jgi:hypothetical protein
MPRLDLPTDDVRTSSDAWAAALAAHKKRVAAYERLPAATPPAEPEPPADEPERLAGPTWIAIRDEVARRAGVSPDSLVRGCGRGMPFRCATTGRTCAPTHAAKLAGDRAGVWTPRPYGRSFRGGQRDPRKEPGAWHGHAWPEREIRILGLAEASSKKAAQKQECAEKRRDYDKTKGGGDHEN